MPKLSGFKQEAGQVNVQALTEEAGKLLRMSLDDLYATLGGQLFGVAPPSKVAGIISYLEAVRSASEARVLHSALSPVLSLQDWGSGLGVICEELKEEGVQFLSDRTAELREALNNEDLLHLADETTRSHIQIILMVVAAVLRLPRELETISVTVTAILLKQGLRNFCRGKE